MTNHESVHTAKVSATRYAHEAYGKIYSTGSSLRYVVVGSELYHLDDEALTPTATERFIIVNDEPPAQIVNNIGLINHN